MQAIKVLEGGFNEMYVLFGVCYVLLVKCTVLSGGTVPPNHPGGMAIYRERTMEKLRTNEKPLTSWASRS